MVIRLFLHTMIIVSMWVMYSSDSGIKFIIGMLFWLYYMRKLYIYDTTGDF
jgi:hypothetical protein